MTPDAASDIGMTLAERCAPIELLLLDVDGVLTDGGIIYTDEGEEIKQFHVRDGSALKFWQLAGKRAASLTGRTSRVVDVRAREIGIAPVIQGAADKLAAFQDLLRQLALAPQQVCFIGDDLPDLPVLRCCGLAIAVADACAEVRTEAHYVTRAPGGRGAVREGIELVLRAQGRWQAIVERYRNRVLV
jgi:3-deoxy-D-manno-octulosonate 8-phosphate phosphatase (KDO 8-P phosphatase)